jgi:outer membrane protein OmpA-like peptidoglycan-associated protein
MKKSIEACRVLALTIALGLVGLPIAYGQNDGMAAPQAPTRTVADGQKTKLKGTIVDREADTFVVRDEQGYETTVRLTDQTSVRSNGGFFRRGSNYDVTNLLRGLAVEVEGRGNGSGELVAGKVRFTKDNLQVARSIETRVTPVEGRLTTVEAQNRSLAGQVDELNEVSKTMREDITRNDSNILATDTRVTSTNERISALDDYQVATEATVLFKVNSAVLSAEAKTALDEVAQQALTQKGYVIEVAGFTDTTGSTQKNRMLSQRRADAVVQYLAETHDIPLRRMITPFGYGELKAAADNDTREGREQNRRVEVKVLVSQGLTREVPSTIQNN